MAKWLNGCEICNYGLVEEMKKLVEVGIGERKAAKILSEMATKKIGTEVFSPEAIRARYRLHVGAREPNPPKKLENEKSQEVGHNDPVNKNNNNNNDLPLNEIQKNSQEDEQSISEIMDVQEEETEEVTTYLEPTIEQPEPEQCKQEDCETENKNIITFDASDEDQWREIGEKMSERIESGKLKPRVGTTVSTAVKKALKKGVKPEPKPIDNFDRGSKHGVAFTEFLTFWADGTIQPESEDEAMASKIARDCLPTIIVQASRLGLNIMAIYEMFIDPNRREKRNDTKEITQ